MRDFTDEELQNMTLEDAKNELSNRLYEAAGIIELLEYKGSSCAGNKRIAGNGHHMRQEIAAFGEALLEDRWRD